MLVAAAFMMVATPEAKSLLQRLSAAAASKCLVTSTAWSDSHNSRYSAHLVTRCHVCFYRYYCSSIPSGTALVSSPYCPPAAAGSNPKVLQSENVDAANELADAAAVAAATQWQCRTLGRMGDDFTCSLVLQESPLRCSSDAAASHSCGQGAAPSSLSVRADADTAALLQHGASTSCSMGTGLAAAGGSSAVPAAAVAEAVPGPSMVPSHGSEPAVDCATEAVAPGHQEGSSR